MSILEGFGNSLKSFGTKVWDQLDELSAEAASRVGLRKQLDDVLRAVKMPEQSDKAVTMEPLVLPEFYQKVVDLLIKNESAFANVTNLPSFMDALVRIKAYGLLGSIDPDAIVAASGARSQDIDIVTGLVKFVVRLKEEYTPQNTDFDKPYKFGTDGGSLVVMVKQDNGDYLPFAQSTKAIPENTSFKNIVSLIRQHMQGLPGGYEVINQPPVVASAQSIKPAEIAAQLVQNPDWTPPQQPLT